MSECVRAEAAAVADGSDDSRPAGIGSTCPPLLLAMGRMIMGELWVNAHRCTPLHRQWLNSSGGHYTGSGSTAVEAASAAATADAEYRAVASLSLFEERQGA